MVTNNTGYRDELIIRDLEGTVQFNDFVGGTILRTILTMEHEDSITFDATFRRGFATDHHGIFTTESEAPSQNAAGAWDPNIPFGSFMKRWSNARVYYGKTDIFATMANDTSTPGMNAHQSYVDTTIRRRIFENTRLWMSHWHFEDGTVVTASAIGYTGRVLIQLP